VVVEFKGSRE
jgi:hypothetical protein